MAVKAIHVTDDVPEVDVGVMIGDAPIDFNIVVNVL